MYKVDVSGIGRDHDIYGFIVDSFESTNFRYLPLCSYLVSDPIDLGILDEIAAEGPESCSTEVLARFIGELNSLMRYEAYGFIDQIMAGIDLSVFSPEAIVALLRVTSVVRSKLSNWRELLQRARAELQKRDIDADTVLTGLEQPIASP